MSIRCFPDKWNGPDSKAGSRCQAQKNQKYCKSVQGDCRHIAGACPPERSPESDHQSQRLLVLFRCEFQEKLSKYMSYYKCQCPDGFTGSIYSYIFNT